MTPPATASFSPSFSSLTPTVTVNQPGIYKFVWKETNSVCGPIRDTVQVTVSDVQLTATPVSPSCGGYSDGSITINSTGATEYSFDGGTNWQPANMQGGFTAGPYTVCARNAQGCEKCINTTIIEPIPVTITVSNDTLICENGTASMVATGAAAPGATFVYHWDHTPSLLATQDVNPAANTTYTVIAENQSGCQSQPATIDVTIRPPLGALITPDQYVCPGYPGSITIDGNGGIGAPYTYTWSTGYSSVGVNSSITESPQVTTTYTVTVDDVCESTPFVISTQIITHPVPVPQIAVDFPELCEPAAFNITNETDPAMSASTEWRISDGQTFSDVDLVQPDSLWAGSYDVTLIVTSPQGCIDSTTFENFLTVRPKPNADFRWSPDPITMFNTEALLQNYSFGAETYQWQIEAGSPAASTSENVVTVFPDGVTGYYTVTLWATSDLGCWDSVTKIVPVMPEILIYAPNTFTPDGDEFNQTWQVYMQGIDEYNFNLTIYNRWGQVIWESNDLNAAWDGTYNGQIVPQGTYNWKIRVKDILTDKWMEYQGSTNVIR
jgi:gliding motility-associated-like protein